MYVDFSPKGACVMIQGVIFDMDGLMFDTERIWNIC